MFTKGKEEHQEISPYHRVLSRLKEENSRSPRWLIPLQRDVMKEILRLLEKRSVCCAFSSTSEKDSKHAGVIKEYITRNVNDEMARMAERLISHYVFSNEEYEGLLSGLARPARVYGKDKQDCEQRTKVLVEAMREWPLLIVLRLFEMISIQKNRL